MTDKLQHHEIIAEWLDDDQGRAIMLTQPDNGGYNEAPSILISPWQLREVCEKFDPNGTSDPQASKHIAMLERRIRVLAGRIERLADYINNHSDHKHADLSFEQTYANATADTAAEFIAELDDAPVSIEAPAMPPKQAHKPVKPSAAVAVQQAGTDPRQLAIDA